MLQAHVKLADVRIRSDGSSAPSLCMEVGIEFPIASLVDAILQFHREQPSSAERNEGMAAEHGAEVVVAAIGDYSRELESSAVGDGDNIASEPIVQEATSEDDAVGEAKV